MTASAPQIDHRYEAERDVARLEQAAAVEWSMGGLPASTPEVWRDRRLREALVDALEQVKPLLEREHQAEEDENEILRRLDGVMKETLERASPEDDLDEVRERIQDVDSGDVARLAIAVFELLEALADHHVDVARRLEALADHHVDVARRLEAKASEATAEVAALRERVAQIEADAMAQPQPAQSVPKPAPKRRGRPPKPRPGSTTLHIPGLVAGTEEVRS